MEVKELSLNRDYMHTQFTSWRLQPLAKVTRHYLSTTGHASGVVSTALDFLHTRASVLRNHLLLSEGRVFVFTQPQNAPDFLIYELLPAPASEEGVLPVQVAALPGEAGEATVGGAVEAVVDCSVAVVAAQPLQPAAAAAADNATAHTGMVGGGEYSSSGGGGGGGGPSLLHDEGTTLLLASRGHGDIVLVRRQSSGVSYSNVVHPLRPRLPYTGVRPLVLEAAVMHDNGDITAVAWAMRSKGAAHAACCEVFAIRLRVTAAAGAPPEAGGGSGGSAAPALSLVTTDVRLLLRTKLPPHVVRPAAAHCAVLLGFDPDTAGLPGDEDAGQEPGAAAASSHAATDAGKQAINDDDDDMDPRTLEQAAARLAAYTSEERQGAAPALQWTDVYKESGPDGLGAMGSEPLLELAAWGLDLGGERQRGAAEATAGHGADKAQAPLWRLQCGGAHRLLSTDNGGRAVGVTDDVDCAVVGADWPNGQGEPQVRHLYSIPALSYVVAGKTYKRHVLLADAACGGAGREAAAAAAGPGGGRYGLAAVLVESQRFMYLYGSTTTMEEYGRQQVVDLGLEDGENVLGARLVDLCVGGGGAGGRGSGSGDGGQMAVVVATQRRLLSFRLKL